MGREERGGKKTMGKEKEKKKNSLKKIKVKKHEKTEISFSVVRKKFIEYVWLEGKENMWLGEMIKMH